MRSRPSSTAEEIFVSDSWLFWYVLHYLCDIIIWRKYQGTKNNPQEKKTVYPGDLYSLQFLDGQIHVNLRYGKKLPCYLQNSVNRKKRNKLSFTFWYTGEKTVWNSNTHFALQWKFFSLLAFVHLRRPLVVFLSQTGFRNLKFILLNSFPRFVFSKDLVLVRPAFHVLGCSALVWYAIIWANNKKKTLTSSYYLDIHLSTWLAFPFGARGSISPRDKPNCLRNPFSWVSALYRWIGFPFSRLYNRKILSTMTDACPSGLLLFLPYFYKIPRWQRNSPCPPWSLFCPSVNLKG